MPDFQSLQAQVADLQREMRSFKRVGNFSFNDEVQFNKRIIGSIFPGSISNTTLAVTLPKGWTHTAPSTGNFTVTHNLGSLRYVVVATCDTTGSFYQDAIAMVLNPTTTTFDLKTVESITGTLQSLTVNFVVMIY